MAIEQFIPEEHDIDWLIARRDRLERDRDALLDACKGLMKHIDNSDLVRNIDNDGASDWAIKMLPLIQTLTEAKAAIELAEKEGA